MLFVLILLIIYVVGVACYARKISMQLEWEIGERIISARQKVSCLVECKETLLVQKNKLESEAMEIFTLYEMTREITQSLDEQSAFIVFEKKLREHAAFKQCRLLEPLSSELKVLTKDENWFVFILKGKRRKVGYLAIEGLLDEDKEKFMIMAHQFALALRRVKLYQEIEQIAITDSLTEVHTRRYTMDRLREELGRSKTRKIKMSFLMLDVDFFKRFNDEYGHLTGDQILREIGEIIRNNIREIDIAGRYGGEEFCVLLPDTDREGAYYAAERIRKATEAAVVKAYDATVKVTVSLGAATFPEDGKKADELIDKADWALYRSKKQGRNRVCSFGMYEDQL